MTATAWAKFDPFLYCSDVNGGACPLYVKRKKP